MNAGLAMGGAVTARVLRRAEPTEDYFARKARPRLELIRKDAWVPDVVRQFSPKTELMRHVLAIVHHLPSAEAAVELLERISCTMVMESELRAAKFSAEAQLWEDFGVISRHVVTTAGVNYIAARMANSTPANISLFNFHGIGTGVAAEAVGDTALGTELTTQYNPDSTRATGTQSNPSGNVYRTLATNAVDATVAITEHGILTQAATGGGTLLDRSVFSAINLTSGDSLQTTYDLTLSAGG